MKRQLKRTIQYLLSLGCIRWGASGDGMTFGLTFDDGPTEDHTPRLLDVLDRHQASATFYVIGSSLQDNLQLGKEIVARGHKLGNHSLRHRDFAGLTTSQQLQELDQTDSLLREITGDAQFSFRPPRGELPPLLLLSLGMRRTKIQMWTYDTMDFKKDLALVRARLAARQPRPRDVLLFHDDGPLAAEVLDDHLPIWNRAGLRATSV